ncbi:unnamed protein product, partial [Timema podura]|nr:unnamed protein product [Timema podura]
MLDVASDAITDSSKLTHLCTYWFLEETATSQKGKDHIHEVLEKWTQIDDEIWAKVIVLERNRRVAKAYARAPVLTINGSDDGFDGFRIGLGGFENPMRDAKTEELKNHVGHVSFIIRGRSS